MNSRLRYLLKNTGILLISNFASKILTFLLVPLYTYILSTEDVGIYDIVVSTVTLLFPIFTLNIADAVMRFLMDKKRQIHEVIIVGIRFIFISFIASGIVVAIISIIHVFPSIDGLYLLIYFYFASYTFNQFMIQYAKGIEQVMDLGISGAVGTLLVLVSNIVFLVILKAGIKGFFLANILGQAVPAIYLFLRTKFWKEFNGCSRVNISLQKEMLLYCVPLIATTIGWWINSAFDRYVVIWICGADANGLLSVAYKIPGIITIALNIFNQAWHISAIKEYGEEDTAIFYGKMFNMLNFCVSFLCSVLICITPVLAKLLFSKEFYYAWKYVPFLLVSSVLTSASAFLGPILSAKMETKIMALSTTCGAVVNVILNIILIKWIGVQGATIATVISNIIIYRIRRRAVKEDIRIEKSGSILMIWALLILQGGIKVYFKTYIMDIIVLGVIIFGSLSEMRYCLALVNNAIVRKRRR